MQLQSGTLLRRGKYRIEKVLGQGGLGITYLGWEVDLERRVAIKEFFMKEYCNRDASTSHVTVGTKGSRELVERFRQVFIKEAETIARLDPSVVRIYDVFTENDTMYYVMGDVEGGSLQKNVTENGALQEAMFLNLLDMKKEDEEISLNHFIKVKPSTSRIHFAFKDSSVPPQFHRSYTVDITPRKIKVQVTCYGDVLNTKSFSFATQQYAKLLCCIEKLKLQIGPEKDDNGMTGGTTIALDLYEKEYIYAKGYNYGYSYGTLFGNVEKLKSEIENLVPNFPKILRKKVSLLFRLKSFLSSLDES